MPTGYTSYLEKDISFKDWILICARAFGACIMLRDEPLSTPIPKEFKASDYDEKELYKAEKELKEIRKMTVKAAESIAEEEYQNALRSHSSYIAKKNKLRKKYESMLSKVRGWVPPTKDHIELKKFMIKQIENSIYFDCSTDYITPSKLLSGGEWLRARKEKLLKDISYHTEEDKKEKERVAGRNKWLKELRESLDKHET